MSLELFEKIITWSGSNSISVAAGANQTSDEIDMPAHARAMRILIKADNDGTATAGDTIAATLQRSLGDIDDSGSNFFEPVVEGLDLGTLDTTLADPDTSIGTIEVPMRAVKLYVSSGATSNSITVSAIILYQLQP